MRRRIYLAIAITFSLASISIATYVAAEKASQGIILSTQRSSRSQRAAGQRTPQRGAQTRPIRAADPNRAPQASVDAALYTNEDFFGVSASSQRPYSDALERVSALAAQYPKDARLRLHAARLSERVGQFDKAASEMVRYAELKGRSPDALRRLASFYHKRARYGDEVRTLRELAQAVPVVERAVIYKNAARLVRSHALTEFNPADFFAELLAADPSNVQPVKDYVQELLFAKRNNEALAALASYQPRFPSELAYFLKSRARVLETLNDRRAAEEIYSSAFDPNWPHAVTADYYDLLRRFGRYRIVRRSLQETVQKGTTDLQPVARLFRIYAYEGNYQQAAELLSDLEACRAGSATSTATDNQPQPVAASRWTATELETAAGMFTSIGHFDQASRYLYTLYLVGGLQAGSNTREEALHRLFNVMMDAAGTPTRLGAGDLSFYKDVAEVDQHPGFMNGVLSLILSGTSPAQEFASQEKAAAGYFNRAFAHRIFTAFKQEYAQSQRLADMYIGVVNIFSSLGEHSLAIQAGREFQQRYPNSPRYTDVTLRMADSYVALKDRANERAQLAGLLDRLARNRPKGMPLVHASPKRWSYGVSPQVDQLIDRIRYNIEAYSDTYDPTDESDSPDIYSDSYTDESDDESYYQQDSGTRSENAPTYSSVLERYVSSLAAEDKKTETVAFFWAEIKKHPREEGLYERFLRWLGQAQLVGEQLRAYDSAIRQFDSNTWYHRLARWYVRQKRGRELNNYSRQLINIFDEEEITEYLYRFAGYGATAAGDQLNWDERLAFDLYSYSHQRFPRNLFFVRGMLTYLGKHDLPGWERLSSQYYFADRSIREPYLAWLSRQNQLRDRYTQAKTRGAADTSAGFAYKVFAADASVWLSHHDEAIEAYRRLASLYPGEAQYSDRLVDLTRSFGHREDKFYEESAAACVQMAGIFPSDHSYRIKAGEILAQLGDFNRAAEQWNRLVELEPGDRETYLEVATVFWDYYQFDQSIDVFKKLREVTGDPAIYAYRMGAVFEAKGDIDSAIAEYVKVLPEPGDGRDIVAKRLAQLARRAGLAEKIAVAYRTARAARPDEWQLVIGYANYLAERNLQADALSLLRTEVDSSNNVAFLESVRDLFRAILRPEDERQVITRLASVARDEREAIQYRLQLASFLERNGQRDAAIAVIDRLVNEYPTNVGVIEESAQFYWRAELTDRALNLYKNTLARARGPNRRTLTLQLARRQTDAGRLADAEATLRAYYAEDRSDTEVFGELARALGAENKLEELAALYREAFTDVREAGLNVEDARARIVELRGGMIRTLDQLGKYQEALDQHIEIINAYPEDADRLAVAIEYAEAHDLTERLTAYYQKLTKDAFKNYRWQLVLGRINERRGDLAGASDQYRAAVANEPQRADLRFALASSLARQRRYDEAMTVLREGWALAGRDPQWLIEVARIQVQQGKRDEAAQTVLQALAAKKDAKAQDHFQAASQLASWGLHREASRIYEETFARLPRTLKDEYVDYGAAPAYIRALVRAEPASAAFNKIERLRAQYAAIAANSRDTDGYKAGSIVSGIDSSVRSDFGSGVIETASAAETTALASALQSATANLTTYNDREQLLRYLGIARGARLVEVEERIYIKIKDAAFAARTRPEDTSCYNELRALVAFYNSRAAFTRAARALANQYALDRYKDRFDYMNQIATEYRLGGDRARELEWLRSAYRTASGDLATGDRDSVERYLSLLHSSGMRDELVRLASSYSPHQLQLINFLIDKGEKDLARAAIANARQTPAWTGSRSGEVGLFLKDTSVENEAFFRAALDIRPIGEMLGRKVDPARTLLGTDWFIAARNYGFWMGLVPSRESDSLDFVTAEIERHPSNARAQLELAAYYLDRKDAAKAGAHTELAAELAPARKDIDLVRGAVALARGDRQGALDAWAKLIEGRANVSDAQSYLRVMADNGFLSEALPRLEEFMVAYINRHFRGESANEYMDSLGPLMRDLARRAGRDPQLANQMGTFFQGLINRAPADTRVGRLLITENLLPATQLSGIYRVVHKRLSDVAAAVFGLPEYENGYWTGSDYVYPAQDLSYWRRRFLDHLIREGSLDEARLLISTIKQEQTELARALTERASAESATRYEWVPLASSLVELRGNDATKAVAELRRYCGLENDATGGTEGRLFSSSGAQETVAPSASLHERCLKAYALLTAEGKEAEADSLLYDAYRAAARSRFSDDASLAGLAEIEARRGRADEASRLLRMLVERSTDNLKALYLAAETAARTGNYADAISFREQIARARPDDAANKLELARVVRAAGRNAEAIDRIVAIIGERTTPNSVRAQAAEVIGEIARADQAQAARAATLLDQLAAQGGNEFALAGVQLARAAIAEATGQTDEARGRLTAINAGPLAAVAEMKLGLIELQAGREAEAIARFERAVYLDADGKITGAIAFRAPGPQAQLIALYGRAGRNLTAIRLAEGDAPGGVISTAVRNALNGVSEPPEAPGPVAFEPSLEISRARSEGVRTLAESNTSATGRVPREVLASLAEAAAGLEQYDRALALERLRAAEATQPEEKTAIERRLAEILAAQQARQSRVASLLRVDRSNTTASIYAARVLGDR
ncbi:MAG: hypothetical protein L0229_05935 [Blastocatellia bacterium]|nr:hypothetical protein [Blastocatellia bacterium]